MSKCKQPGYIAVARDIFDHVRFRDGRIFSDLEAWLWLLAHAAWKPSGKRRRHNVVHAERGQVAATIRELSTEWNWPQTNVVRFLRELVNDGSIRLERAFGTRTGVETGVTKSHSISLITICHYDKFQGVPKQTGKHQAANPTANVEQDLILPLEIPMGYQHQPFLTKESVNKELKRSGEKGQQQKPRHGAKGRGMIWIDHDRDEWQVYADDYREARGAEKLPESRIGGRGNWFRYAGETKQKRA